MKQYLVNILQATVASDRKARIHKICKNQPANCRLSEIEKKNTLIHYMTQRHTVLIT